MAEEETDLAERVANIEFWHLATHERLTAWEERLALAEQAVTSLEADRADAKKRVDAVEKSPAETKERLDAMEKRLRTVEGAVGSAAYHGEKAKHSKKG